MSKICFESIQALRLYTCVKMRFRVNFLINWISIPFFVGATDYSFGASGRHFETVKCHVSATV